MMLCRGTPSSQTTVCLVSGGASGLGRATVERISKLGAQVVLIDLPNSRGEELVNNLGANVSFIPGDVSCEAQLTEALKNIKQEYGRLDLAVNCAGIAIACKTYNFNKDLPHSLEDFTKILKVNAVGTFNVVRLAAGLMGSNFQGDNGHRGVIINTSSIAAFDGQTGQVAYAASNGAIASMTLPLARDFSSYGIRVVTIAPGIFKTPMTSQLPSKVSSFLSKTIPYPQRFGDPNEYAHLVQAIYENQYINGEIIRLDGAMRPMF